LSQIVVLEALTIAVVGLTLAVILGVVLGIIWIRYIFPAVVGWIEIAFPAARYLAIGIVTLVVCMIASVVPATRVSRLRPAVALRYE